MTDSQFLNWVADRLVHVYGESPNTDFVLKLRSMASASPAKLVYDCSTPDCQCDACCIERGEAGPFNDVEDRAPSASPAAQWEDHRVQKVYEILCRDDAPPPGEHWEGFQARLIVDAICGATPAALTDEQIARAIKAWFDDDGIEGNFELRMRNAILAVGANHG